MKSRAETRSPCRPPAHRCAAPGRWDGHFPQDGSARGARRVPDASTGGRRGGPPLHRRRRRGRPGPQPCQGSRLLAPLREGDRGRAPEAASSSSSTSLSSCPASVARASCTTPRARGSPSSSRTATAARAANDGAARAATQSSGHGGHLIAFSISFQGVLCQFPCPFCLLCNRGSTHHVDTLPPCAAMRGIQPAFFYFEKNIAPAHLFRFSCSMKCIPGELNCSPAVNWYHQPVPAVGR